MQLELPRLEVMRDAGSCHDLWKHVTNPEYFDFRMYVKEATGEDLPAYGAEVVPVGGEQPEHWARAQRVIDALEWSLGLTRQLLPDKPTAHDVQALDSWLEQGVVPGWLEIESKVLHRVLNNLSMYLGGLSEGQKDDLVRVPSSA